MSETTLTQAHNRRRGSVVEHIIGNDEIVGSIPTGGTIRYFEVILRALLNNK
jgi:hypothetical protein